MSNIVIPRIDQCVEEEKKKRKKEKDLIRHNNKRQ